MLRIAQETASLFGQIIEIQSIQSQRRIEEITATSEAEQLAIEQSATTEAEKQRQLEALRLRTERKIAAEKRRQAEAEKAAAIFQATIGTAVAGTSYLTHSLKPLVNVRGLSGKIPGRARSRL